MAYPTGKDADAETSTGMGLGAPLGLLPMAPEPLYRGHAAVAAPAQPTVGFMMHSPVTKDIARGSMLAMAPQSLSGPPTLKPRPQRLAQSTAADAMLGFVPPPLVAVSTGVQPLPPMALPHHCVTVGATPQAVLAALPALVLGAVKEVHLDETQQDMFAVKGKMVLDHCAASFAIGVFAHQEGGTAVEFRRTRGDPDAWHAFFVAAVVQLRAQYPSAAMLGGWRGEYPALPGEDADAAGLALGSLPPLEDEESDAVPLGALTAAQLDDAHNELEEHGRWSTDEIAVLARAVDPAAVGGLMAAANAGLILQHGQMVDTLVHKVLRYKHDAAVLRGALFVLHSCCTEAQEQRRLVRAPLHIMDKILPLLDCDDIVVQHVLRLVGRLAPEVLAAAAAQDTAMAPKWGAALESSMGKVAKYARGDDPLVTEEVLAAVRRLGTA